MSQYFKHLDEFGDKLQKLFSGQNISNNTESNMIQFQVMNILCRNNQIVIKTKASSSYRACSLVTGRYL